MAGTCQAFSLRSRKRKRKTGRPPWRPAPDRPPAACCPAEAEGQGGVAWGEDPARHPVLLGGWDAQLGRSPSLPTLDALKRRRR